MKSTDHHILTEPEAAEFLRIGLSTLRKKRRMKAVPHLPGKPTRYIRASLEEWISSQEVHAQEPDPAPYRPAKYNKRSNKSVLKAAVMSLH